MKSKGVELIAAERKRQIGKHGWTAEHDDEHDDGSLAMAAACYASPEPIYVRAVFASGESFSDPFPWWPSQDARPHNGNVMTKQTEAQRMRLLEKAGALIAAELDRLWRAKEKRYEQKPKRAAAAKPSGKRR